MISKVKSSPATLLLIVTTLGTVGWVGNEKLGGADRGERRRVGETAAIDAVAARPQPRQEPAPSAPAKPRPVVAAAKVEPVAAARVESAQPVEPRRAASAEEALPPNLAALAALPKTADGRPDLMQLPQAKLLAIWVMAQNDGDFGRYSGLYGASFSGVKRVGNKTTTYDRSGWLADRRKMFAKPMTVDVSDVDISLAKDMSSVTVEFKQVWSSGTFADEGRKRIVFGPVGDGWRIVSEEMLWSKVVRK